jgi:hypothetical protein
MKHTFMKFLNNINMYNYALVDCVIIVCIRETSLTKYRSLLKRMHLIFMAWVESRNTGDDGDGGGEGSTIDPVKNMSFSHYLTFFPTIPIC